MAINIEMHNVYQGGLGNTKAELSIYIERDAEAAFESTTPPLAIQADPLRRWLWEDGGSELQTKPIKTFNANSSSASSFQLRDTQTLQTLEEKNYSSVFWDKMFARQAKQYQTFLGSQ